MNRIVMGVVGLTACVGVFVGCGDDYYGDEPVPGDVSAATIEQAFTSELFSAATGTPGLKHVVATFSPGRGQVCMVFGITELGPLGVTVDLADLPVYTAQVFQQEDEIGDTYFNGSLFRWDEEGKFWETFGVYEYHPGYSASYIEVDPNDLDPVSVYTSGSDIKDYLETLNPCRSLGDDATQAP